MDFNPYQAPAVLQPGSDEEASGVRPPRPIGIWILAGLHLATGLLFLAIALFFGLGPLFGFEFTDFPYYWLFLALCSTMAALALATGAGLWLGYRWGWWMTATYHVWGLIGGLSGLVVLLPQMHEADAAALTRVLVKEAVALAIHAVLLIYLFRPNVREFFRLHSLSRGKALFVMAVIGIVLTATVYFAVRWPFA